MTAEDKEKLRSYLAKNHTYTFKQPIKAFFLNKYKVKETRNKVASLVEKVEKIPCLLKWASLSFSKDVEIYPGIIFFADIDGTISSKGEDKIAF
jgi:hypothetical protein